MTIWSKKNIVIVISENLKSSLSTLTVSIKRVFTLVTKTK